MSDIDNNDDRDLGEPYESEETPAEAAAASSNRNFLIALGILGAVLLLITVGLVLFYLSRPRSVGLGPIEATNNAVLTANAGTAQAATETRIFLMTPSVTPTATETPVPPTATNTSVVAIASPTEADTGPAGPEGTQSPQQQTLDAITGGSGIGPDTNPQTQTAVVGQVITLIATSEGIIPDFNIQTQTAVVGRALTLIAENASGDAVANLQTETRSAPAVLTQSAQQTLTGTRQALSVANLTATASALPTAGFADEVGLPGLFCVVG